jgi:hypothetical protein
VRGTRRAIANADQFNVSHFKMRGLVFLLVVTVGFVGCASASPLPNLTSIERVEIWDQRVQDIHAKPKVISDPQVIAHIAAIIQGNGETWQSGSFTEPSGYMRLVFIKSSRMIAAVGVGARFLVYGPSDNWYSRQLNADDEMNLQRIANSTLN